MADVDISKPTAKSPRDIPNEKLLKKLQKSRFLYLVLLAILPDVFYMSFSLYVIKMRAKDYVRCEIKPLENTSWSFQEIRQISHTTGFHRECYVYQFDYSKISNMTFQKANYLLSKKNINITKMLCRRFVTNEKRKKYATIYGIEFAKYCKNLEYEILYDSLASAFVILSCFIFPPLADLSGRTRVIDFGLQLALCAVFIRIIMIGSGRSLLVTVFLNAAYPALKYTTQTIIFEISNDIVRPYAFILTYTGSSIFLLICGLLPLMSWQVMKLFTFSTCLFLPLLKWCVPESPSWLKSKNKKEAIKVVEALNEPYEHSDILIALRNDKIKFDTIKNHVQEISKISKAEFISLTVISFNIGFLSFYPRSKYKFMYHYFEQNRMRFFNYLDGLYAALIGICLVSLFGSRLSLAILLCINGFFYALLCNLNSEFPYEDSIIFLVTCIEISAGCANILYQFYLSEISPDGHRCSYIGFFNMFVNLGIFVTYSVRLVFASEIMTTLLTLMAFTVTVMFLKPT